MNKRPKLTKSITKRVCKNIMRTEAEMFNLILDIAQEDDRIRAVYMNGSRTNPNVPKDIFQDYDIVYVVNETESFRKDKTWIDRFGKRLYMQCPEENDMLLGHKEDVAHIKDCYGWLIQFADGNRLDLHIETVAFAQREILTDKLCKVLLDKDYILPMVPSVTDEDYWVKKPSATEFSCVCNEFWWCLNNVAKGLWREEVPYVQDMLNLYIRPQLIKVLGWKIGFNHNFTVSVGKSGKYMNRFLTQQEWESFLKTYASYRIEEIWDAVMIMCQLFNETARKVASKLKVTYNEEEAKASQDFLLHVRTLPKEATAIY